MNLLGKIYNSIIVKIAQRISSFVPFRLIWLQKNIIDDVYGALLKKQIEDVAVEIWLNSESFIYPQTYTFENIGCRQRNFQDLYLVEMKEAFVSPLTGLCWKKKQYFTQSVGCLTSCFGYRTAFRQVSYLNPSRQTKIENAVVVANTTNISHFILEDLPGIITIQKQIPNITIIINNNALKAIYDILEYFFNPALEILKTDKITAVRKCYFVTRGEEPPFIRPQIIDILRNYILHSTPESDGRNLNIDKVYISRRKSKIRAIENEQEIENYLLSVGFTIVFLEDLTFVQQVQTMKHAKIVIGLHGAGLTNILWANKDSRVLEIFPLNYCNPIYEIISYTMSYQYRRLLCDKSPQNVNGRVSIEHLQKELNKISLL